MRDMGSACRILVWKPECEKRPPVGLLLYEDDIKLGI
jgi:hypothetical protein